MILQVQPPRSGARAGLARKSDPGRSPAAVTREGRSVKRGRHAQCLEGRDRPCAAGRRGPARHSSCCRASGPGRARPTAVRTGAASRRWRSGGRGAARAFYTSWPSPTSSPSSSVLPDNWVDLTAAPPGWLRTAQASSKTAFGVEIGSCRAISDAGRRPREGWRGLVYDPGDALATLEATADALMEVDLVITVDTMLAPAAGTQRPGRRLRRGAPRTGGASGASGRAGRYALPAARRSVVRVPSALAR